MSEWEPIGKQDGSLMKVEIVLKSGYHFIALDSHDTLEALWDSVVDGPGIITFDNDTSARCEEIAAIRRIEEATERFEPVSNDPEEVWERERARKDDLR